MCTACLLAACSDTRVEGGPQPFPGSGPGGKPMRTATETAVGMPAAAPALVYPVTARGPVADNYFGTQVADPYRWLENLDSPEVRAWVAAQNALAQPQLAQLPARPWLKARLSELWNYERFELPVRRGGRYFYLHNDGTQNQSVLEVAAGGGEGRVLFDPNTARSDATVALGDFLPDVAGRLVAYALADGGSDWQVWRFKRVADGADLADTLRFTKFWGVSWARDGTGVYYSRYPALPDGRGDDAGRPAVYFHRIGTAQDQDRLVYAVTDHPTHVPAAQVTEDGRYLIVTLHEGTDKNGVDLLDLERTGAKPRPLFSDWDALYVFIGAQGHELYFRTTRAAPLGQVIAVDTRDPAVRRIVVPEGSTALEAATYVGGRIIARYVEDAHAVVRVYERDGRPAGSVALPGLGRVEGFRGEGADTETFFSYSDYLTPLKIYRFDVPANEATLWHEAHAPAQAAEFVTEQVFFASKDGTRVPMYVSYRRGAPRDGNQPLLLY
ncbi:MAG: S9 family peptidase, partial [Gammaproteobacteria bacterium]|nr:S9 family peptidase [Gammaproteobacteria bacterium]